MDIWRNGFYAIFTFAVLTLALASCNTMEGAGKDTQDAGKWIEEQGDDDD